MRRHYLYLIECVNGSYYTGYTSDIKRRYQEHLAGNRKCKYTRSFPPSRLAQHWLLHGNRSQILKLEKKVKRLSKIKKQQLVAIPETLNHIIQQNELDLVLICSS